MRRSRDRLVPEADRPRRAALLAAVGLYVVVATLLFAPLLARGEVLCFRDLADYAIPHKLFSVSELRRGQVPLWNPWDFFGFPHLANLQSGALSPLNLLLLLPFPFGFDLSLIVHFVIAALGAFVLAREMRVSAVGATIAGLSFGFGPFLLSLTDLNAFLATSSWLPWQVALAIRLGRRPGVAKTAVLTVVFALAFLAGEPQTFAMGALLAVAASLFEGERTLRQLGRLMLAWGVAAISCVLLVAPVLLPFLELALNSERSGAGLTREEVYRYSLEGEELLTLVLPGYGGDVVAGSHWLGSQTYVRRPFLGVLVLALAAAGLLSRGARSWATAVVGIGGLLMAMGPSGVLYPVLYDLGFRQSRFPVKFLVFAVLALAVLAARGFDVLLRAPRERRNPGRVITLVVLGALAALGALFAVSGETPPARLSGVHTMLAAVGGLVVLVAKLQTRRASFAIVAVLAVDLGVASRPVLTSMPAVELRRVPNALAGLRFDETQIFRWPRVLNPLITRDLLAQVYPNGRFDAAALRRKQALLFGNTNLLFDIPVVRGGESVQVRWVASLVELLDRGPESRVLLDLAGVGFLVHTEDLSRHGFEPLTTGEVSTFGNSGALPRAFLVERVRPASEPSSIDAALLDPGFVPREEAVSERPLGELTRGCSGATVAWRSSSSTRLELEVDSPGRCLLVVTDTWYPGWEAMVDGLGVEIHRVDGAFRGVILEHGRHEIAMSFKPASFHYGLRCAGVALLGWVIAAATIRARSRGRV